MAAMSLEPSSSSSAKTKSLSLSRLLTDSSNAHSGLLKWSKDEFKAFTKSLKSLRKKLWTSMSHVKKDFFEFNKNAIWPLLKWPLLKSPLLNKRKPQDTKLLLSLRTQIFLIRRNGRSKKLRGKKRLKTELKEEKTVDNVDKVEEMTVEMTVEESKEEEAITEDDHS